MKNMLRPAQLIPVLLLLALALLPPVAAGLDDNFWVSFFARVLVYAIAASALNIALGFGGLVFAVSGDLLRGSVGVRGVRVVWLLGVGSG